MADSHGREVNRRLFPSFLAASPLAAYGASSGFAQGVSAPAKLPDPIA